MSSRSARPERLQNGPLREMPRFEISTSGAGFAGRFGRSSTKVKFLNVGQGNVAISPWPRRWCKNCHGDTEIVSAGACSR